MTDKKISQLSDGTFGAASLPVSQNGVTRKVPYSSASSAWINSYGIVGDAGNNGGTTDNITALNALIDDINAGTVTGTLLIPREFDIGFSARLNPITSGNVFFESEGQDEARFSLLKGSSTRGGLFKFGVYGGTRVTEVGFRNVGLYNRNWEWDDGSQWALEIENANMTLERFHTDGGLGIRHGYQGTRCAVDYFDVTCRANVANPNAAIWGCSGTSRGNRIGVISVNLPLTNNSSFNSTSNWVLSSGAATITGGSLIALGVGATFTASNPITVAPLVGTTYSVIIVVSNYVSGSVTAQLTGGTTQSGTPISGNTAAAGSIVDIVAVTGNTTVTMLFSSDANFTIESCTITRKASSSFRPIKIGGTYNDGVVWDNIDAWKWDGITVNQARGNLISHAIEIDYSKSQIGSCFLNMAFGELAGGEDTEDEDGSTTGSPWYIHDTNGTGGRIRGLYITHGRATVKLGNNIPAIQIVSQNGNEVTHAYWRFGNIAMAQGPGVKITAADPTQKIDFTVEGASYGDRARGAGTAHTANEIGANGFRAINNKLHISYKGIDHPSEIYNSKISTFLKATADLTLLEVRGNKIIDCLDTPNIDISALTNSWGSGIIIDDNVGSTVRRNAIQEFIHGRELKSLSAASYLADFESERVWSNDTGGGTAVRTVAAAALTGTYITVFSATNATRWTWLDFVPYDSAKLYKITFRLRRNSGTVGNCFLGIVGFKADRTTRVARDGTDTYTLAHYVAAQGEAQTNIASSWTTYTGYFTGTSSSVSLGVGTLVAPLPLHTDVRFVCPHVIFNNSTGDCQIDVDSICIETVSELVPRHLLYYGGTDAFGDFIVSGGTASTTTFNDTLSGGSA